MYPSFVLASAPKPAHPAAAVPRLAQATAVDRAALGWLLGRVLEEQRRRRGLGVSFNSVVDPIIDGLIARLGPTVGDWAQKFADQAEPKVREIAREEIAPRLGMYAALAMLGAGMFAGVVGAFFASRGYGRAPRAPAA
jgi:hypothetical protein